MGRMLARDFSAAVSPIAKCISQPLFHCLRFPPSRSLSSSRSCSTLPLPPLSLSPSLSLYPSLSLTPLSPPLSKPIPPLFSQPLSPFPSSTPTPSQAKAGQSASVKIDAVNGVLFGRQFDHVSFTKLSLLFPAPTSPAALYLITPPPTSSLLDQRSPHQIRALVCHSPPCDICAHFW